MPQLFFPAEYLKKHYKSYVFTMQEDTVYALYDNALIMQLALVKKNIQ